MATLTGQRIKDSYKDLLQVSNSNSGIDSTLRAVSDGEATSSLLQLSTVAVNISSAGALQYAGVAITSTAAELNILDGATVTVAELNILDGVTASATDINLIDGITNGTVIASKAIITDSNKDITGGRNITISGELDAATLDISGDADIDGTLETDALTIGGVTSVPFEAADHSKLDGIEASATADQSNAEIRTAVEAATDSNVFTDSDHSKLNAIEASATADQTNAEIVAAVEAGSDSNTFTDADHSKLNAIEASATADQTDEEIQDVVGAMFSSNTETGITATYQDGDGTIDLVVGTLNQDTTGTASKATVTDSTANTNFPVVFHDEGTGNVLLDDTGALRYNPSTGELLVPKLTVAGTTTTVDTVTMEAANAIKFEGATADANETILSIVDPTNDDNTQYLLNASGYIPLLNAVSTTVITATPTELNYVDGVTSNIQTQLDATLDTAGTGIDISSTTVSVDVSDFMANGSNNRILTATGTDAMNAEANLTFDGTTLAVTGQIDFTSELNFTGAGDKIIDVETLASSNTFKIRHHNPTGNVFEDALVLTGNAGAKLYYNNGLRLETTDAGVNLPATKKLYFDGGSDTYISEAGADYLDFTVGGALLLRMQEAGTDTVITPDNVTLGVGDSNDLRMYHNSSSTNNNIENYSGSLYITNEVDDADIILRSDDGSGGVTAYLQLDGSAKYVRIPDDGIRLTLGADNDLAIFHNGTNGFIGCDTGDLTIQTTTSNEDMIFSVNDGGSQINAIYIDSSNNGMVKLQNDLQYLTFGSGDDGLIYSYQDDFWIQNQTQDQDIKFRVNDGGVHTDALFIQGSTTNIGIGTTSPSVKLHINDNDVLIGNNSSGYATLSFHSETTGSARYASIMKNYDSPFDMRIRASNSTAEAPLVFDGDSNTEYARFDTSGRFGIGTASPLGVLNVIVPAVSNRDTDAQHVIIANSGDAGKGLRIGYDNSGHKAYMNVLDPGVAWGDLILQDGAGKIGIGTASPGEKLTIKAGGDTSQEVVKIRNSSNTEILSLGIDGSGDGYLNFNSSPGVINTNAGDLKLDPAADVKIDGASLYIQDSEKVYLGTDSDFRLYHDGSNGSIENHTGNLYIDQNTDNGEIIFRCDDNSGGLTSYMALVGTTPAVTIQQDIKLTATKKLYLDGGSNTYLQESSGDILNLYVGGENMLEISAAGSDPRVSFFNKDHRDRDFSFNGDFIDHAVYFDSSAELLLIGTNTGIATLNGTGALQVLGTGNGDTLLTIGRFSNNASAPTINFAKSRNGTIGSHTIVQDDDSCGEINWTVSDGSDFISYIAQIEAEVDGTPGSNDVPGRLMFKTTADGAAGPTEHFRISQDGALTATDTSIGSISDKRIKKDIKNFTGGLELISKLTPRTFKYRSPKIHFDGVRRGFIAQEVQAVDEYWIDSYKVLKDNEDYQYVKDTEGKSFASKLTDKDAMYVSAIQELKREIDELKLKLGE